MSTIADRGRGPGRSRGSWVYGQLPSSCCHSPYRHGPVTARPYLSGYGSFPGGGRRDLYTDNVAGISFDSAYDMQGDEMKWGEGGGDRVPGCQDSIRKTKTKTSAGRGPALTRNSATPLAPLRLFPPPPTRLPRLQPMPRARLSRLVAPRFQLVQLAACRGDDVVSAS